jgi:WD40 repeat protein
LSILDQTPALVHMFFHDGPVESAEFSPEGRRVLTGSADGPAAIWDLASGERAGPLLRHKDLVELARFSGDGPRSCVR